MIDGDRMQMQAMPLARSKVVAEAIVALHKALQTLTQNPKPRLHLSWQRVVDTY
jgi:hypothetical protein